MSQVTLTSPDNVSVRLIVESALKDRAQQLELAIHQTEARIQNFEKSYGLTTSEFLAKFRENDLQHSFDFDEWIGESRLLARLQEKLAGLQSIQIVD